MVKERNEKLIFFLKPVLLVGSVYLAVSYFTAYFTAYARFYDAKNIHNLYSVFLLITAACWAALAVVGEVVNKGRIIVKAILCGVAGLLLIIVFFYIFKIYRVNSRYDYSGYEYWEYGIMLRRGNMFSLWARNVVRLVQAAALMLVFSIVNLVFSNAGKGVKNHIFAPRDAFICAVALCAVIGLLNAAALLSDAIAQRGKTHICFALIACLPLAAAIISLSGKRVLALTFNIICIAVSAQFALAVLIEITNLNFPFLYVSLSCMSICIYNFIVFKRMFGKNDEGENYSPYLN